MSGESGVESYQFEDSERLLKVVFVVFGQKRCFDWFAFHSPDMSPEVYVREFGERVVIDVRGQTIFAGRPLDLSADSSQVLTAVNALPLCSICVSG